MKKFTKLKQELMSIIPAVIYFAIAFNLIFFTTGLALQPGETRYFSYLTVTLGALIVGKVLLIVNYFSFVNAFPNKPLIYNITWKFFIYTSAVILAWFIEEFIKLAYRYDNIPDAFARLHADLELPSFWSSILWLALVFLIFVVFHEFACAIGRRKVMELLFGSKSS